MIKFFFSLMFFLFLSISSLFAQKSAIYTNESQDYDRAVALYKMKQYYSAQILFNKVNNGNINPDLQSDCAYYAANCALHLETSTANKMMERFIAEYPSSTKINQAHIDLSNFYFRNGDYEKALKSFEKIDESGLDGEALETYSFQKGYALFTTDKKKESAAYFSQVLDSKQYGSQAKYYLGFMAYEGDDYKNASKYFDQVAGDEKYNKKLSYFQADMSFKAGNFAKAIELGTAAMAQSKPLEKSELNKIIGESHFNLKQYDQALPFLTEYKGKHGKWTNNDYYQLGYVYYKQKDYENAISQFNKIISGKDTVAQNAFYHLGESYLKTNKKQQALNAFKNASEMKFEPKIQEDAFLNYAKLSYDIGNSYQSIPDVLTAFIQKYPKSKHKPEIEKLLVDSFITSKNYKGALELLDKDKTNSNKEALQKVAFYRALELYNDGDYKATLPMLKRSLSVPIDQHFEARATFWKGETEYVLNQFAESLVSFKKFYTDPNAKSTVEFKNIQYNIGYCHFKLKEYEAAGNAFQSFIETIKDDKIRLNDAYLRLGDSRFVTTKYWAAIEAYNKVIENKGLDADYALFQRALCFGFLSKPDKKIEDLNKFIVTYTKSKYRDDVMFELGNTYVNQNKSDLGIKAYDQLITEYSDGIYVSKAILRQGLVYYTAEKDEQAIEKFKKVAAQFPKSPEAAEAIATARIIYVDNGKVDEYATWVKSLDYAEVSDIDLDNDTYEAAEKQYLQNNPQLYIKSFTGYLTKFPEGLHVLNAHFYIAQGHFIEGDEAASIPHYEYVIAQPKNEFSEPSLARLSEMHLKKNDFTKAIPVLKRLEVEADFPQNNTFAQSNLMRSYYEQKDYKNAVVYAEKVLANPKTDNKVKSDAQIIVARSAMQTNDEVKAKAAYAKLGTMAKGELAAEALYYEAYFKNKELKFEDSNTSVMKLTKEYSGYKYFGAKGLVLMAKNFYGLQDSFQATYILESVIKNFGTFTDVVEEAQKELDAIKTEEAKTNSSVTK